MNDERSSLEQGVASKYGLNTEKDREFFDAVWEDADEREETFADLESFEAFVEYRLRYYALPGGRDENLMDLASANGGRSGWQEKPDERDNTGGDSRDGVFFDPETAARSSAFGEYLAKIAACDKRVMRLRDRICGDVTYTFSPEKALEFLEANSIQGAKEIAGHPDSLRWPDGGPNGRIFRVPEGSTLEELKDAAAYLEKHYPWKDWQAAYFTLCGETPKPQVLGAGYKCSFGKGVAAHIFNRGTIKLEVEDWVPSEYVRQAYCKARERLEEEQGCSVVENPRLRNTEVFRFVLRQSWMSVVNKEERLGWLDLPSWPEMRKDWNSQLKEGHPWRYEGEKARYFKRDFKRAQRAVIGTDHGLPGVPDQPKTIEETKEEMKAFNRWMREQNKQRRIERS